MSKRPEETIDRRFAEKTYDLGKVFIAELLSPLVHRTSILRQTHEERLLDLHLSLESRLLTLFEAIRVLISRRYSKEAAILCLAMLETVTDLLYIGDNPAKSEHWLQHCNRRRGVVRMDQKWSQLELPPDSVVFYKSVYEHYSMIKHGNPAAGIRHLYSTPRRKRRRVSLDVRKRLYADLGLSGPALRQRLDQYKRVEATLRKVRRDAETREADFVADLFCYAGMLLYDSFRASARAVAVLVPDEAATVRGWESRLENGLAVLV